MRFDEQAAIMGTELLSAEETGAAVCLIGFIIRCRRSLLGVLSRLADKISYRMGIS